MEKAAASTLRKTRATSLVAAFLSASFAVGCAGAAHKAATAADRELSRQANAALSEAGVDTQRVEASSYHGVVALLGEADADQSREAQRAVLSVPGVVRVNNLVLSGGSSTSSGYARAQRAPMVARVQAAQ